MNYYKRFNRWTYYHLCRKKGCLAGWFIDGCLCLLWLYVSMIFLYFSILFVSYKVILSIVRGVFRFIKWVYRNLLKKSTPKPSAVYYGERMTGLEYEHYCAKRLALEGFSNLVVTSGSGDYGADIIGYDLKGRKICFQCKKHESSVGVSAVQEVLAAKVYYNADRAAVLTTSTFTPAARKLAKSGNVELIERYL